MRIGQPIVMLAFAMLASACGGQRAEELQLVDVRRADLVIGVEVSGELAAVDSTDIKPPSVDSWNFKISKLAPEGTQVGAGDVVVGFDTSEQMRELETVANEAEAASKQVEKKQKDIVLQQREDELAIANAEAALRKAKLKAQTPDDLVASVDLQALKLDERASEIALELARNRVAQNRRSNQAELAALRSKLEYAKARLARLKDNVVKMQVKAPRAGTVVYPTSWRGEKKKVGDSVWRMEAVLQVVGLDKMIGKGEVDEIEMAKVVPEQPVSLRLDALPDVQLHGKVRSIAQSVRAKSNNDPSRVVEIKITLDPTTAPLRPGMRFRGEVEVERVRNVVQVPVDAVFVTPSGPVAYRERDSGVEEVPLQLGKRSSSMIEVTSGLVAGDRVTRVDPRGNP